MVSVERGPQGIRATVESQRRPLIYLDQWAIYELSRDNDTRAKRFVEFFNDRGELLLSSINLIEMGQLRGDSLKRGSTAGALGVSRGTVSVPAS